MKLELLNSKTMKLEILSLDQCEPGIIYLVPKIIRCKDCDCIIQHYHGWKCPNCNKQWEFSDYSKYFGMIRFDGPEPYKLRKLCDHCFIGDLHDQIAHRIHTHHAEFNIAQRTIRYPDHLLDVIPPELFIR